MESNYEKIMQNLKENGLAKAFVVFSLLAILVIGGIVAIVGIVLWTGYPPVTGYTIKIAADPAPARGDSLPYQGVSQAYLDNRFAQMKAAQAMYEKSGVLEDSANSYYGVNSVSGPGCKDSDNGHFYVKGTTTWDISSMTDHCDGADWLVESYCDGDMSKSLRYRCPNGCVEGACK
ncbi:MAG: hypothetical protein V1875_08375 [Candidatus Altiarchaeota archaeon]